MPRVSVIVPSFNHAPYLELRLKSISCQAFRDFEVIIVDDCSTDNSASILQRHADINKWKFIQSSTNSGNTFHQWKKGVERASGEYVWIAESDDAASPAFLQTMVALLDQSPDCSIAYCNSLLINGTSHILGDSSGWADELKKNRWRMAFRAQGLSEISQFMSFKNCIPNASAVLIRAKHLEMCHGIVSTTSRLCGDWLQWIKLLSVGNVVYTPDKLNYWRQGSSNARTKRKGLLELEEGIDVIHSAAATVNMCSEDLHERIAFFVGNCARWMNE